MARDRTIYGRVLALDDEKSILGLYERVFNLAEKDLARLPGLYESMGLDATTQRPRIDRCCCQTADEAIAAVRAAQAAGDPFAIILLDLNLGAGVSGVDVAVQIRALDPNVNIVIVTGGFNVPPIEISARVPPAEKLLFLRKPLDLASLAQFIVSLSAKWHSDRAIRENHASLQALLAQFRSNASHIGDELDVQHLRFQQMQQELNLVYAALQSAANAITIIECNGNIKWCNPAFSALCGYSEEEVRGRHVSFFCLEESTARSQYQHIWSALQTARFWKGEMHARRKDGSTYMEEQTITAVHGDGGEISHYVAVRVDLTERILAEEAAQRHQRQMVQADKLATLGILVSGVAHEINNPNHFILSNVTILRDCWRDIRGILERYYEAQGDFVVAGLNYSEARDSVPDLFGEVLAGARRIGNIVEDLRNYARETPPELNEEVDLNGVMRAASTLMSNMISKSTDTFQVAYCYDAPKIRGNFQKLEQVVINVLQNACQALPSRDRAIEAGVCCSPEDNSVSIYVKDRGIGIPEARLQDVTVPFFTTKRSSGGTGLGLSISSNIVREHGGTMRIESVEGEGTTVEIRFPVSEDRMFRTIDRLEETAP